MTSPVEPCVFQVTVESLSRALGPDLGRAKSEMKRLGIDFDQPLLASYPLETFNRAFNYASELLYPSSAVAERHEQLGRRVLDSFGQTIIGSVLLAMTRVAGPRRMLERTTRNMRQANNYTEITLEERGPKHVVLHFNRVAFPDFYKGMMLRGLELSGGKNGAVSWARTQGDRIDITVKWE